MDETFDSTNEDTIQAWLNAFSNVNAIQTLVSISDAKGNRIDIGAGATQGQYEPLVTILRSHFQYKQTQNQA